MAVTQNTYTGDGTTVLFSFTFPYLDTTDIKVSLNGTVTTAYTLANATTIQFNTAPANGAAIRIYRLTAGDALNATFYPGSAIRSQDLNENFTQNLYVTQEATREAASAVAEASSATSTANTALSTAQSAQTDATNAVSVATAASASAASAVSTANAASSSAASAVSTANTASTNATSALNAVSSALLYVPVANVAAIPASPTNGQAVRVLDSTGIESFTPLTGIPGGYVGNSALGAEIYYSTSGNTWVWNRYTPNDPETRYGLASDLTQAQTDILALDSAKLDISTAASTYQTQAGMSGYLATGAIGTTVQAYDANTAKTNVAQSYSAAQRGTHVTLTDGATITPNFAAGNHFTVTLGGNRTLANPTNLTAGQSGVIYIVQDGTGSRTLAYGSNWDFAGGTAPTLSTAANAVDVLCYAVRSNSSIAATLIKDVK